MGMDRREFVKRVAIPLLRRGFGGGEGVSPTANFALSSVLNRSMGLAPTNVAAVNAALRAINPTVGGAVVTAKTTAKRLKPVVNDLKTTQSQHAFMNTLGGAATGGIGGGVVGDRPGGLSGAFTGALAGRFGVRLLPKSRSMLTGFGSNRYLAPGVVGGGAAGLGVGGFTVGPHDRPSVKKSEDTNSMVSSLVSGTLPEAVETLARLSAARQACPPTQAEKAASAGSDWLSRLGDRLKNNSTLTQAAIGGVAGAGIGALGAARGGRRKSILGGAITGGLAGAGLGAGVSAARAGLSGLKSPAAPEGPKPGEIITHNGRQFRLSPEALKANPNLLEDVSKLEPGRNGLSRTLGLAGGGAAALANELPGTTGVAAADTLLHNPFLGLRTVRPENATGAVGKAIFGSGMSGDEFKNLPESLRTAVGADVKTGPKLTARNGASGSARDILADRATRTQPAGGLRGVLARLGIKSPVPGDTPLITTHTPTFKERKVMVPPVPAGGPGQTGTPGYEKVVKSKGVPVAEHLTENHRANIMRQGAEKMESLKGRNLYRGWNGTRVGMSPGRAMAARALLYPALALGENFMNSNRADSDSAKAKAELLESLIGKGHVVPAGN